MGIGRAQRLVEFINGQFSNATDMSMLQTGFICEDYEYLTVLMAQANDAETAAVKQIWDDSKGDEAYCKKALQKLNGGKTWKRLLREYFPQLRQARVMMFFGTPVVAEPQPEAVTPEKPKLAFDHTVPPLVIPTSPITPTAQEPTKRLPLIAVRTNLLHDFFYMPNFGFAPSGNIQLEYFPCTDI